MNLTSEALAAAIRKVCGDNPHLRDYMLEKLADELNPLKFTEEPPAWIDVPPKPKPPDGFEFVRDEKGKRVYRPPRKEEWFQSVNTGLALKCPGSASTKSRLILRRIPDPEGWLRKFYNKPADQVPAERALEHGLTKWEGARRCNLDRYGLVLQESWIRTSGGRDVLQFDDTTCALCQTHQRRSSSCAKADCSTCPVEIAQPGACTVIGAWGDFLRTDNPEPMIAALEKAIAERDVKAHEQEKVAKKVKVPQPGEFLTANTGRRYQCLSYAEYKRRGGVLDESDFWIYALCRDGQVCFFGQNDSIVPWQPKVGDDVWAYHFCRWHRVPVTTTRDSDAYIGVTSPELGTPRQLWFQLDELRPIDFPPKDCCTECGAKQ